MKTTRVEPVRDGAQAERGAHQTLDTHRFPIVFFMLSVHNQVFLQVSQFLAAFSWHFRSVRR